MIKLEHQNKIDYTETDGEGFFVCYHKKQKVSSYMLNGREFQWIKLVE